MTKPAYFIGGITVAVHSTDIRTDTFMEQTKAWLRNFLYETRKICTERDRFLQLHGIGEAQILQQIIKQSEYHGFRCEI